jgi:hypothetical protein
MMPLDQMNDFVYNDIFEALYRLSSEFKFRANLKCPGGGINI